MDPIFWLVVASIVLLAVVFTRRWFDDRDPQVLVPPVLAPQPVAVKLPTPAEAVQWAPAFIVNKIAPVGAADSLVDGVVQSAVVADQPYPVLPGSAA